MVAAIRRDRPFIATLLEQALPVSSTAAGVLTLQVDSASAQEGLVARSAEVLSVMSGWLRGLQRFSVRYAGDTAPPSAGRMTVESVRTETVAALRKRDPMLASAIDALELDLVE
jgi:hypothetical protein